MDDTFGLTFLHMSVLLYGMSQTACNAQNGLRGIVKICMRGTFLKTLVVFWKQNSAITNSSAEIQMRRIWEASLFFRTQISNFLILTVAAPDMPHLICTQFCKSPFVIYEWRERPEWQPKEQIKGFFSFLFFCQRVGSWGCQL